MSTISCDERTTKTMLPLHAEFPAVSPQVSVSVSTAATVRRRKSTFVALSMISAALFLANIFLCNGSAQRSMRHPLSFPRRKLNEDDVRFLTLGGPSTWGQGLENPESEAYPYLLSHSVHNAAQRVGGPTLASLCTQSIVGEENYDVIVLEFTTEVAASLSLLTKRLKQRFPLATIVFVQLWSPSRYIAKIDANTTLTIAQWKYENVSKPFETFDWVYQEEEDDSAALLSLAQETQAKLFQLNHPDRLSLKDVDDMFIDIHRDEFFDLFYTLSPGGHQVVADGILSLLDEDKILQNKDRNVVGDWGDGDSCQLWYDTGLGVPEFSRLIFSRFSNNKKYALEVPSNGGSITINNPFDQERMVYLTYMTTTSAATSNKIYPQIKVQINDKNSVILDPYHDDNSDNRHITRTSAVGSIPPGRTTIHLDPVEITAANFRLVGASLLATEKITYKIPSEFALSPEPAYVFQVERDLDI